MNTGVAGGVLGIVWGAAASVGVTYGAATVTRATSVSLAKALNVDTRSGHVRLRYTYRQKGADPIWMEAERPTELEGEASTYQITYDARASGGMGVARVKHMAFQIEVATPGRYTAWYRGFFPWGGYWNHSERMDDGTTRFVGDSRGEVLNRWIWTRGPTYDLTQGRHVWYLTPHAWMGGAELDKVVLARDPGFVPRGTGGASAVVVPTRGEIVTKPVSATGVVRWGRVNAWYLVERGSVVILCSTDGARTWQTVLARGDLSRLPVRNDLVFKLILTPDKEGVGPILSALTVTCLVRKHRGGALQNAPSTR